MIIVRNISSHQCVTKRLNSYSRLPGKRHRKETHRGRFQMVQRNYLRLWNFKKMHLVPICAWQSLPHPAGHVDVLVCVNIDEDRRDNPLMGHFVAPIHPYGMARWPQAGMAQNEGGLPAKRVHHARPAAASTTTTLQWARDMEMGFGQG